MSIFQSFRPLPLLGNGHIQTLLGHWLQGPPLEYPVRIHELSLPDGDRMLLYDSVPARWLAGSPAVVLVHGMAGCAESGYMRRVARLLLRRGLRVVRLDTRGHGRGLTLARRGAHSGLSDDLRLVLDEVARWSPGSPVALVGFSLGGNTVLKLAGEIDAHAGYRLACVVAMAPPIALEVCSELLSQPRNRLYERYFVRDLVEQARRRQRSFPDQAAVRFDGCGSIRGFDDLYTAPHWGFAGAGDYYRRCSSQQFIPHIAVPTLILTARDDPFIAVEPFQELQPPGHVQVVLTDHGGHLGFVGFDGSGGIRWAERRIVEWIAGRM